jgi:Ca2+:H+ antiporter
MMTGVTSAELEPVFSGDEADVDGEGRSSRHRSRTHTIHSRDFESGAQNDQASEKSKRRYRKSKKSKRSKKAKDKEKEKVRDNGKEKETVVETITKENSLVTADFTQPQVGFAAEVQEIPHDGIARRPFNIRNISEAVKPAFSSANFPHHEATGRPLAIPIRPTSQPRVLAQQVRRTASMPDILHPTVSHNGLAPSISAPPQHDASAHQSPTEVQTDAVVEPQTHLSKTSAVVLLLCSTGLVALCAEFLVGSIDYLIANSGVSQAFIGLIILPIVGNAAEHVTAVTVAAKNKMDLAINIALGSSIQIALFVTPLMVILGWIIKTDMSLYFSLFETVSLFASAFIVSFLMIDGRSNYLEGALLIAAYVIIAVAAFFYPTCDLSSASGPLDGANPIC